MDKTHKDPSIGGLYGVLQPRLPPPAPSRGRAATQILLQLFPTKTKAAPADADIVLTAGRAGSG